MNRWDDCYYDADFCGFWEERAKDPKTHVLVVLGIGFDPRCLNSLRLLGKTGLKDRIDYIAFRFIAKPAFGKSGEITEKLALENMDDLMKIDGCNQVDIFDVEIHDVEGHNVAGRKTVARIGEKISILTKYTDVIVDISGMPRGVYFPLISYFNRLAETNTVNNLHVAVVENPELDSKISGREYSQADYLHTFRHQGEERLIWLPLIGANEITRIEKIHNKLRGFCIEICPIFPFPASSLRRVDDIAVKHADVIFEGLQVSIDNILLCDERTPFDIYRKILEVEEYYRKRLGTVPEIGKIITVVSPLSSKTLSLGMLLAAIERSLPVCYVEAGTYQVEPDISEVQSASAPSVPTEFWLCGEPYE